MYDSHAHGHATEAHRPPASPAPRYTLVPGSPLRTPATNKSRLKLHNPLTQERAWDRHTAGCRVPAGAGRGAGARAPPVRWRAAELRVPRSDRAWRDATVARPGASAPRAPRGGPNPNPSVGRSGPNPNPSQAPAQAPGSPLCVGPTAARSSPAATGPQRSAMCWDTRRL